MSYLKRILCYALIVTLCLGNITVINKKIEAKEFDTSVKKSVFEEIEQTNISNKELREISKTSLIDGEKTAEKINLYTDDIDYEEAVKQALNSYYEKENFKELKDFENNIDSRSDGIIKGYKDAAKEREKGDANGYEAGKVILVIDGETTEEEIKAMVQAEDGKCEEITKLFNNDYIVAVSISLGQTVEMAEEEYLKYSIVDYALSNDYAEVTDSVADYVNDPDASKQYYLDSINAKGAWDYVLQKPYNRVLVGVIDTGIQLDHPELDDVISPYSVSVTKGETPVLLSECDTTYVSEHGTTVAGVIAAEANNNHMLAGVASCYNNDVVEILAVQAAIVNSTTGEAQFSSYHTMKAINYCVEQGVKVINYSAGFLSDSFYCEELLKDITDAGIIFVCSAGNDSSSQSYMPADLDRTISAVAVDENNKICDFSNYGMKKDICAPGSAMYTTSTEGRMEIKGGTSYASPVVAAVVAMMCAVNSELNYVDVRNILADTATDITITNKCRNGLVNAAAAVELADGYKSSELVNLALDKPVTVSSTYDTEFPASNIVDDDDASKWISEITDKETVTIDLEKICLIDKMKVTYDRYIRSALKVEISMDGIIWTELANGEYATLYVSDIITGTTKARYVRFTYTENTSYVIIKEIRVWGYETLSEQAPAVVEPQEVFGQLVTSTKANQISVVWGSNAEMEELGQLYNVYIDNVKVLSNVACISYDLNNISAGTHMVKITSVFNGKETIGVTSQVTVLDESETTTLESGYVTAGTGWTHLDYWSVYFANWGGNPTGSYKDGGSYNDFGVYVKSTYRIDWTIRLQSKVLDTTIGKTYKCKVSATYNLDTGDTIVLQDAGTQVYNKYALVKGINNFEIEFTPTANNTQIDFNLGKLSVGGNFVITSFSLEEKTEEIETTTETLTEETTTLEETTTTVSNTIAGGIELNGYQISATVGGMRTVYSVDSQINGKNVISSGLIYSLTDYADEAELYVGNTNNYVRSFASTTAGKSNTLFSDSDIATSYVMTMKFASKEAAEYSIGWRVRAYAQLEDGTYVYSKAYTYTIYNIADILYSGRMMNTKVHHEYLYSNILSIVNKEYEVMDYDWSSVVVGL